MDPTARKTHSWDRDTDNWYVEPGWCSARLFEAEDFEGGIVDPCAGSGRIVRSAMDAGLPARGFDLRWRDRMEDSSVGIAAQGDFFADGNPYLPGTWQAPNIVSNPPYGYMDGRSGPRWEERFIEIALTRATRKVAVFLQASWPNGGKRSHWLEALPWYRTYLVSPRPSCPPGTLLAAGGKAGNGTADYAWFVFLKGFEGHPTTHFLRR